MDGCELLWFASEVDLSISTRSYDELFDTAVRGGIRCDILRILIAQLALELAPFDLTADFILQDGLLF
jgi:hypothetical protein